MRRQFLAAAVLILLLATALRFHNLEVQSFWNDEGNSARLSERSIPAILEGTAGDIHPPLYYLLLRGWREPAGEHEFGLRSLSAFAGVLTVAATLALGRIINAGSHAATIAAGALAAAAPVLVYYSQETRMYALLGLLAALSTLVLLKWLRRAGESSLWSGFALGLTYVLLIAAGLYTHYFFPAVIAAQSLLFGLWLVKPGLIVNSSEAATLIDRRGRMIGVWLGMMLLAGLFYLPWLPIFLRQIGGRSGDRTAPLGFLLDAGRWLGLGATIRAEAAFLPLLAGLLLVLLGVVAGRRRAIVPLIMAATPLLLMAVAGATDPAFFKFLLVAAPFVCLLAGLSWRLRGTLRLAPVLLSILFLWGSAQSLSGMYTDPAFARADYRGMAARIAAEAHPNAGIILNAPNQWEAFTYYYREGAPVYPLPRGQPAPAILEPELAQIAARHDRLYALFWGDSQRDPERVVERWLDAHAFKTTEEWVGDVRYVVYAVPREEAIGQLNDTELIFEAPNSDRLTLTGYSVSPTEALRGDILQTTLAWTASNPTSRPYKVFLHLLDENGQIIAQRDSEPAGGSRPTTGWTPGETIIDRHGLLIPAEAGPGVYRLTLGLYDAADPAARLTVSGTDGRDSWTLATINIR